MLQLRLGFTPKSCRSQARLVPGWCCRETPEVVLAELKGHVQRGELGDKCPLGQHWVASLIFYVMQRDNLGYRENLGARGSIHGAGAAVGG